LESKQDLESRLALSNASDEQSLIDKLTLENDAHQSALATIQDKKTQINTDISEVKSSQSQVKH
jgi:chromosome segregation protein